MGKKIYCGTAHFWSKVDIRGRDKCWRWLGSLAGGYPRYHINRKGIKATRIVLEQMGYDMTGLQANHHCDNPVCVNPRHLYAGTQAENMRDMVNRNRSGKGISKGKGFANPNNRHSLETIREVKRLLSIGMKYKDINARLGVSIGMISNIKNGNNWTDV